MLTLVNRQKTLPLPKSTSAHVRNTCVCPFPLGTKAFLIVNSEISIRESFFFCGR